jgi:uroporphyrinogen-III synthase
MSGGRRGGNFERSAHGVGGRGGRGVLMTAVLVVRKFDNFSRILTEKGFSVINCAAIETVEGENLRGLDAKISAKNYDGIFLTSRTATEIAVAEIFCKNSNYHGKVYVLGKSSFDLLNGKNLDLFFAEKANTAREMLAAIPPEDLKNKRFLFIRGEKSLGTVAEFLKQSAAVDEEIVYRTRKIAVEETLKKEITAKAEAGEIAAACFFSPSGAESFLEQFGAEILRQTKIAAIGKTTADFFYQQNLKTDFTPVRATAEDFANELIEYLGKRFDRRNSK